VAFVVLDAALARDLVAAEASVELGPIQMRLARTKGPIQIARVFKIGSLCLKVVPHWAAMSF